MPFRAILAELDRGLRPLLGAPTGDMQWETADRRGRVSLLTRSGTVIVRMERRHGSTSPIAFLEVPALDRCAAALNIVRFYLDFMPDPEPPAMPPPSPA